MYIPSGCLTEGLGGMCKVTVIVPVYNIDELLLRKCIDSILAQTEKSLEVFIVDDGSTNNAPEVCDSYSHLGNVSVIHQENQGVSVARNVGMERSAGEWIMFVDPDDYIEPNMLETMLGAVDEEDDVVQSCCKYFTGNEFKTAHFFDGDTIFGNNKSKFMLYCELLSYNKPNEGKRPTDPCWIGAPWAKMYRKSFLTDNKLTFDAQLRRVQDVIFNLYVLTFSRQIHYIDAPLYVYNFNHLSNYHSAYNPKIFEHYCMFAQARYDWYEHNRAKLSKEVLDIYYLGTFSNLMFVLRNGPLHRAYPYPAHIMRKECEEVMGQKCFLSLRQPYCCDIKPNIPTRLYHLLIRRGMWLTIKILSQFVRKLKLLKKALK